GERDDVLEEGRPLKKRRFEVAAQVSDRWTGDLRFVRSGRGERQPEADAPQPDRKRDQQGQEEKAARPAHVPPTSWKVTEPSFAITASHREDRSMRPPSSR